MKRNLSIISLSAPLVAAALAMFATPALAAGKLEGPAGGAGFGPVLVGTSATKDVVLKNTGNAPVTLSGAAILFGDHKQFTLVIPAAMRTALATNTPFKLAPGAASTFKVTFRPNEAKAFGSNLHVPVGQGTAARIPVKLAGTGVWRENAGDAVSNAQPGGFNYGRVVVGKSKDGALTIGNRSRTKTLTLKIEKPSAAFKVTIDGAPAGSEIKLAPRAQKAVKITFAPTAKGSAVSAIRFTDGANTTGVTLIGEGVAAPKVAKPAKPEDGEGEKKDGENKNNGGGFRSVSSSGFGGSFSRFDRSAFSRAG